MIQITIIDNQTNIKTNDFEINIEGDFEIKKKGTEVPIICDNIPPHTFPLLNKQECQHIYEEKKKSVIGTADRLPKHLCNNKPPINKLQ